MTSPRILSPRILLALTASALVTALASAQPEPAPNLLQNGGFNTGEGRSVYRWLVPPTPLKGHGVDAIHIDYGIVMDSFGNPCLGLSTAQPMKAHIWFQQEVTALPAASYELTVRLAGEVVDDGGQRAYLSPDVLIYFLNANGGWIGHEALKGVQFTADWQTATLKVSTPEDVAKIGVRLGVRTSAQVKVRFDDAKLVRLD